MQVLQERGESTSRHGRATFSVLLFQVSFSIACGKSYFLLHQYLFCEFNLLNWIDWFADL